MMPAAPSAPVVLEAVIPRATYRLQLHRGFDFDAARALLPYLHRLGISHVYCSPIATATAGSQHGYDVVDPTRINPELGGRDGFERLARAARELGMGLLLDVVPNHMGVFDNANAWWAEVLEHGQASGYARFFDIDWQPADSSLAGKVLLPVLGASYGETLERGELTLSFDAAAGRFAFAVGEHRFPLDPRSYAAVLEQAFAGDAGAPRLVATFAALPDRDPAADGRVAAAHDLQRGLARLVAENPTAAAAVAAAVDALNAAPDKDALDALHEAQGYRLAYWSAAGDDINYRRFFDVNALAALRIEDPVVFETTQRLALDLAAAGLVDGLRIDHPDGLLDPGAYFEQLQAGFRERRGAGREGEPPPAGPDGRPAAALYVVAEKIAAGFETLPAHWPLHGATGYRFGALVNGLFVERRHARRLDRLWRLYGGVATPWAQIAYEAKRRAARVALGAQATALAHALRRIALSNRMSRDFGLDSLRFAIVEVAAAMPVYRTYIAPTGAGASAQDERFIDWAVAHAERVGELPDPALFAFLRRSLLGEPPPKASPEIAAAVRMFAARFQQYSSPVAAKGGEDTAYYRYHRLVSLNEVGGDPAVFGTTVAAFHGASADRAKHWPHTLLATSTHDNKRAEDVRNRIDVLSEQPKEWHRGLHRWRVATRSFVTPLDGRPAPSPADQFLLHQTLLGSLPVEPLTETTLAAYRERIEAYMLKATCEAKLETSWTRRHAAYEDALVGFVRQLLGRVDGNPVLAELQARARELAWFGALNSLATTVLKYTSPGVPDLYQGTELIDLSLVDPDNRRPVDYELRQRLLAELDAPDAPSLATLAADPTDGRLKLWTVWRLLMLRRDDPALFGATRYLPLGVQGPRRGQLLAFARRGPTSTLVVAVARRFVGLDQPAGVWPVAAATWAGTRIAWPRGLAAASAGVETLSGREIAGAGREIGAEVLFEALPFAVVRFAHA